MLILYNCGKVPLILEIYCAIYWFPVVSAPNNTTHKNNFLITHTYTTGSTIEGGGVQQERDGGITFLGFDGGSFYRINREESIYHYCNVCSFVQFIRRLFRSYKMQTISIFSISGVHALYFCEEY